MKQKLYRIFVFDGFTFDAIPKFGTLYNFAIVLSVMGIFIESYKFIINIKNKKFKKPANCWLFYVYYISHFKL